MEGVLPPRFYATPDEALADGANESVVAIKFSLLGALVGVNEDAAVAKDALREIMHVSLAIAAEAQRGLARMNGKTH